MTDEKKGVAFLVGIDEYEDPKLQNLQETTIEDVKSLIDVFDRHKYSKYRIYNPPNGLIGKVTGKKLKHELKTFLSNSEHKDVLIYFSGHGYQIKKNKQGYLATSDSKLDFKSDSENYLPDDLIGEENGLSFDDLSQMIANATKLNSLVLLLDACHSGYAVEEGLLREKLHLKLEFTHYIICSSLKGERSLSSGDFKQGVFTKFLVDRLKDENLGPVNPDHLFEYVKEKIDQSDYSQNPIMVSTKRDSLVLIKYPLTGVEMSPAILDDDTEEAICPYRGLQYFDDNNNHQQFFFGREGDIEKIRTKLNTRSFVLVIGASGSGKSSVVRAGLVQKRLRQEEQGHWDILPIIKPGDKPLKRLKEAFAEFAKKTLTENHPAYKIIDDFTDDGLPEVKTFDTILEQLKVKGVKKYLLVIDQFEEVFTLTVSVNQPQSELDEAKVQQRVRERDRFLELVTRVADVESPLKIVVTMRADFFGSCLNHPTLKDLIDKEVNVYIAPLNKPGLIDAIEKPAARQGYPIAPELRDALIRDVGDEPGYLPLLEFTLEQLWKKKVDEPSPGILMSAYEDEENKTQKISGLKRALNLHANKVYEDSDESESEEQKESKPKPRSKEEQEWIRLIFLRLVRTGRGNTYTRQPQRRSSLLTIVKESDKPRLVKVIESLIKGRLLVSDQSDPTSKDEVIDLAHEALIEGWEQFVEWLDEDRESLRLAERLEDAYQEWDKAPEEQKKDYLMMGALLAQVREKLEQIKPLLRGLELSVAVNFYELSNDNEKKSIQQLEEALTEAKLRESAARVQNFIPTQPLDALLLAIETVKTNLNWISEKDQISKKELIPIETLAKNPGSILGVVQAGLSEAVARAIVPNVCEGHEEAVNSVAFSSDGKMIVSDSHNMAYFWDSSGNIMLKPKPLLLCTDNSYFVDSIAFSSKSKKIVGGCSDSIVRVWSFDGKLLSLEGHEGSVSSVAFSPDGKTIVSASEDKTIRLWNSKTGKSIGQPLCGHQDSIKCVAFSPNGQMIVSGSEDTTVRLWNIEGSPIGQPLRGHDKCVYSVAFSPDGQMIVSGSEDTTVRLWNIEGSPIGQPLRGHNDFVKCVAFSPNGQMIVSGSGDTTVRLWNIEGSPIGQPLRGHNNRVNAVTFSPNGQMIVSGSSDKNIILWAIINHNPVFEPLCKHTGSVNAVAFSPDGEMIVSGSTDKTLRLWNSKTGKSIGQPLRGHEGYVNCVAFSPNGEMIVSGSFDETLRLWNSKTGKSIGQPLRGHQGSVNCVAFSPDGQMIVSGSSDSTIRLWNIQGECIDEVSHRAGCRISSVTFSPSREMIATGSSDGELRLWKINNNCIIPAPQRPERRKKKVNGKSVDIDVNCVAFSPNEKMIVSGTSDGNLRWWGIKDSYLEEIELKNAHPNDNDNDDGVKCVAFSPDGQMIVSGGSDKVIRLWDIKGNTIGQAWSQHENIVTSVAFSPDGKWIATGSLDNKIYLWRGGWREWLEICCKRLAPIVLKQPRKDMRNESCEICVRYKFWSSADFAAILKCQGDSLAKSLQEKEAEEKFIKAKEYDHNLEFEPKAEAKRLAALSRLEQLSLLARKGRINEVIQAYSIIDQTLEPPTPSQCDKLCWFGSLHGHPDDPIVMAACEKAVELQPENGSWRGTRGVAKALRSTKTPEEKDRNIEEAIEDFNACIADENIDEAQKRQCQQWIDALWAGKNPFTKEEIQKLLET